MQRCGYRLIGFEPHRKVPKLRTLYFRTLYLGMVCKMIKWERNLCPDCNLVWERNLDDAWRYISVIAVPVPADRVCPICSIKLCMHWVRPLPLLPEESEQQ